MIDSANAPFEALIATGIEGSGNALAVESTQKRESILSNGSDVLSGKHPGHEARVLVLAPSADDWDLIGLGLAGAGIASVRCADAQQLGEQLLTGAAAVLMAEVAVKGSMSFLTKWLGQQAPWSDLPVLVLACGDADSPAVAQAVAKLGNVTVIAQPIAHTAWVNAVSLALRQRRRQYRQRDELSERERNAERLDMAMAAANAGSWEINLTTGEFSASNRALQLHGLPPGTTPSHEQAMACIHPDDRTNIKAALQLTLATGKPYRHEHRVFQPDGSLRWVASRAERQGTGQQMRIVGLSLDVTERKLAELQLRASEERFRLACQAVKGIIFEYDVQTGRVERSQGLHEVLGYQPDEAPPNVEWWWALIHPEDREASARLLAATTGNSYLNEYRVRHRDGHWLHVEERAVLLRDDGGKLVKMVGCTTDIAARKLAQAGQLDAQQQMVSTLQSITDAFTRFDKDWRVVYLNDEAERMNQRPRAETLGKTIWELFPELLGTQLETEYRRCADEQVTVQFEYHYAKWEMWSAIKCYPVQGGGLAVSLQDITARKKSENLQAGQLQVLELVAADAPLQDILSVLCGVIEGQHKGWHCALVLPDAQHRAVGLAVAPSLPVPFLHALQGVPIEKPYFGPAMEVLLTGKVVTVPDVTGDLVFDPKWRRLLLDQGMQSCWYMPVLGQNGAVLASFTVYSEEFGDLEPVNKELMDVATYLASIAIQRHQSVVAILRSEERFRTLFESMDQGFCVVQMELDGSGRALDYRMLQMNAAFDKHTGMQGLLGKSVRQAIPGLEEFWFETYGRVAVTGEPIRFTHAAGPMDGRWFDVDAFRLGEAGSNLVAILFKDITASWQAQEAVKATQLQNAFLVRLSDVLRSQSDPVVIQAAASRLLGEQLEADRVLYFEIQGDDYIVMTNFTRGTAASIVGRYPISSFGALVLAKLRAGTVYTETDVPASADLTENEKKVFADLGIGAHLAVPVVKDGYFIACLAVHSTRPRVWTPTEVAIAKDTAERAWSTTEQVRAEAALRASELQRRMALDAAELGTWHVDIATRLTQTDARFREIFGTRDEWTDYLNLFSVLHPQDLPAVELAVAAATRLDNPTPYAIEHRVIHPDGAVRWVLAKGRASQVDKGGTQMYSFDGTVQDITARKLVEQSREQLVTQLRDADQHKNEFLATLAHELRNPLAPLRNGLQLIKRAQPSSAVEQARAMMDRQLTQLVRLVDDLMDVSRVTSNKLELRKERVTLRAVIDAAVETSQSAIVQAGHELIIDLPAEPILVDADAARLAQVVSNLLNNSAKYTHPGGRIWLTAWCDGATAVLSMKDNGIGIPPGMLGRVFDMFTQVDRTLEKTTGGMGIGLSLVKGLVQMHGGTIEAKSSGEGMGSEFVIRLPMAVSTDQPTHLTGQNTDVVPSARHRILVVDDNVDAAESLACLLEMLGQEVCIANDGEAGIEVAMQFKPDMVMMDIGMPKLNGYEAARRIRQQPWGQGMVLVALTGWGQADDRRKSANAGFDHHVVKPLELDDLLNLLESESLKTLKSLQSQK